MITEELKNEIINAYKSYSYLAFIDYLKDKILIENHYLNIEIFDFIEFDLIVNEQAHNDSNANNTLFSNVVSLQTLLKRRLIQLENLKMWVQTERNKMQLADSIKTTVSDAITFTGAFEYYETIFKNNGRILEPPVKHTKLFNQYYYLAWNNFSKKYIDVLGTLYDKDEVLQKFLNVEIEKIQKSLNT